MSWELDQTLERPFVLVAVDRALEIATPEIWNSDQGSHFTSSQYIERLLAKDVRISMDGKGRALDNIFTERHVLLRDAEWTPGVVSSMKRSISTAMTLHALHGRD